MNRRNGAVVTPKRWVAQTYLVYRRLELVVLQTFLDQRHQRMGFNVARKWQRLGVGVPCTLQ